ncbi:hypothetical protein VB714_27300 [Spirulina sp. 06S082]|nr:hypothetical protein [Spirulina sp. 06S082]MEA5472600.1 hypothetical protein [Spirulina sp. 06S082]
MASKTETEIEELRQLILAMDLKAEKRMDRLEKIIEVGFTQVNGEIKRIDERIGHVEKRIDDTNQRIDDTRSSLEKQMQQMQSSLEKRIDDTNQRIDDTNQRIDDTNTRLNSITIGFFSIVGILVTGMLTVLGKLVFFPNPLS